MRRLVVNDCLSALPDHRTFWNDLVEWLGAEFVGGEYATLAEAADKAADGASLIVRNASYFPPIAASARVPTIALLQDIFDAPSGHGVGDPIRTPQREMQESVIRSTNTTTIFNSAFTASKYLTMDFMASHVTIPLPVDFRTFEPGNAMGLQQALGLPDGCVCWVGACREAGPVKGFDIFMGIVRANPDISFVAVFKDALPESMPPNVRGYVRLTHDELSRVMGACRVGLCTSRTESQHLAGIEMGACGLPMVAPQVGVYWKRHDLPGALVDEAGVAAYSSAVRATLANPGERVAIREYWRREFDRDVVKAAWMRLVEEVECGNSKR